MSLDDNITIPWIINQPYSAGVKLAVIGWVKALSTLVINPPEFGEKTQLDALLNSIFAEDAETHCNHMSDLQRYNCITISTMAARKTPPQTKRDIVECVLTFCVRFLNAEIVKFVLSGVVFHLSEDYRFRLAQCLIYNETHREEILPLVSNYVVIRNIWPLTQLHCNDITAYKFAYNNIPFTREEDRETVKMYMDFGDVMTAEVVKKQDENAVYYSAY